MELTHLYAGEDLAKVASGTFAAFAVTPEIFNGLVEAVAANDRTRPDARDTSSRAEMEYQGRAFALLELVQSAGAVGIGEWLQMPLSEDDDITPIDLIRQGRLDLLYAQSCGLLSSAEVSSYYKLNACI